MVEINGKNVRIFSDDKPNYVLIHPTGKHELDNISSVFDKIRSENDKRFCLASFEVEKWNAELSPWCASQAFGNEPFGDGASDTLKYITDSLIPALAGMQNLNNSVKYICGGYSLAGLFSLWAAYNSDVFSAVSCCSPSVWIEGWTEYTSTRNPMVKNIYLSIGSKENRTGNPVLKTVRERIEFQHEILTVNKINTSLEINHGNHFQDNIERVVKGYLWCLDNCD